MSSVTFDELVWVGMDVSRDTIVIAVLGAGEDTPRVDRVAHEGASVRRFFARLGDPRRVRACYEAGPTGYGLFRLLASMRVQCEVVAPSLIPKRASDRVKTDRRDAIRLVRLFRAGELVAIRVPTPAKEAVRELVRARVVLNDDRKRMKNRVTSLLLRHGRVWRHGSNWTQAHWQWIAAQSFDERAQQCAFNALLASLETRSVELAAIESELMPYAHDELFTGPVHRLGCYRGLDTLHSLTLAAEVCDWRRFPAARAFMGFTGLIPSEYSSGQSVHRGHLTKAGPEPVRTTLVEAAQAYRHRPKIGVDLKRRQQGAEPDTLAASWTAQRRLHRKYVTMTGRGKLHVVAVCAVARELAGFVWAEMTRDGIAAVPGH